jgi:hypothetical protein
MRRLGGPLWWAGRVVEVHFHSLARVLPARSGYPLAT